MPHVRKPFKEARPRRRHFFWRIEVISLLRSGTDMSGILVAVHGAIALAKLQSCMPQNIRAFPFHFRLPVIRGNTEVVDIHTSSLAINDRLLHPSYSFYWKRVVVFCKICCYYSVPKVIKLSTVWPMKAPYVIQKRHLKAIYLGRAPTINRQRPQVEDALAPRAIINVLTPGCLL